MRLKKWSQAGFGHLETFLVMAVIVAIIGTGLYVSNKKHVSHAASVNLSDYVDTTGWSPDHSEKLTVFACKQSSGGSWEIESLMELSVATQPNGGPYTVQLFDGPAPTHSGGRDLFSNLNSWLYGIWSSNNSYVNPNNNNYLSWTLSKYPNTPGGYYWYIYTPFHRAGTLKNC